MTPANKGKKMPFNANSAKTQFKPGQRPANAKPLWHERIGKSGYVEWSVPERNPYTGHARRYRQKHIWLWEQANGPIPKGHCLKCVDGDRLNTKPANWIAIPRSLLPRLAGRWSMPYDQAPADLKPTILALAKLQHGATNARKRSHG